MSLQIKREGLKLESKIYKWCKLLKLIFIFSLLYYIIQIGVDFPQILSNDEWSDKYTRNEIEKEINIYVDTENSVIKLRSDAIAKYLNAKKFFFAKRISEIICNVLLISIGIIITTQISKGKFIDSKISISIRWCGILMIVSSLVIPTLGHVETGLTVFQGSILEFSLDFYRLEWGLSLILLSYLLQYVQTIHEKGNNYF